MLIANASAQSLASRFSSRFAVIQNEISQIDSKLISLPEIPKEDMGGMEAYAKTFGDGAVTSDRHVDVTMRFIWPEPALVDLVALIPARKFTATGLDPEYGFPDDFTLTLIDSEGVAIEPLAEEKGTSTQPIHNGYPYVYEPAEAIEASGLELRVSRLREPSPERKDLLFFAISEVFCFSGEMNLIPQSELSFPGTSNFASPYWSPGFMMDEITPLGLPELPPEPGKPWQDIGWTSIDRGEENSNVWIRIDLREPKVFDGLRMFPAFRPSLQGFPGFGIPRRYRIEISETGRPGSYRPVFTFEESDLPNPGSNPVTDRFEPVTARFVRLVGTKLWKPFPHYPAFLALSEIEILNGEENVALEARIRTPKPDIPVGAQGNRYWSASSLTDGHGPKGELVSRKEWLSLLDRRHALEIQRHHLVVEAAELEKTWSRASVWTLAALAAAGILAVTILPFRYRLSERRRIRIIRDRIAGDLHDDVGSNLGSIQLLSAIARGKTTEVSELNLIDQVAAETVTSVRDIVWLLRPRHGEHLTTIEHLKETASILLESLDWKFETDLEDFALTDEDGRNLVLFVREALHNLIRHSKASHATLRLKRNASLLVLEIEDNGAGISAEALQKPHTLRALKQRSRNLGGTLEIDSTPGSGTCLRLAFTPQPVKSARAIRYS